jgi:hypothetical protein
MNIAFDTLGATKRLRDAGLEERAAEAIVELVQSTAQFPDISGLATKAETATSRPSRRIWRSPRIRFWPS